jgi:hypothetical protein
MVKASKRSPCLKFVRCFHCSACLYCRYTRRLGMFPLAAALLVTGGPLFSARSGVFDSLPNCRRLLVTGGSLSGARSGAFGSLLHWAAGGDALVAHRWLTVLRSFGCFFGVTAIEHTFDHRTMLLKTQFARFKLPGRELAFFSAPFLKLTLRGAPPRGP